MPKYLRPKSIQGLDKIDHYALEYRTPEIMRELTLSGRTTEPGNGINPVHKLCTGNQYRNSVDNFSG